MRRSEGLESFEKVIPQTCSVSSTTDSGSSASTSWSGLVERIQKGDPTGLEDLYHVFSKGIRFLLYRQFGPQDLDDKVHDAFLVITQSIQRGDLREPERLMGYVRTVVRRQISAHIQSAIDRRQHYADLELIAPLRDRRPTPEHALVERQKLDLALRMLNSIPKRDREVLTRFYLQEQTPDQICQELQLTATQFRLIKSRAKARFGALGQRSLVRRVRG